MKTLKLLLVFFTCKGNAMDDKNVTFEFAIERGCGIDVHKKQITVTVGGKKIKTETREFSTFTKDLMEARKWIKSKSITHIAMESTGVYWKPLFNIFEEDFEIVLVNARHVHQIPGNKTDKKDSRWLCKLLLAGLLKGSFIPPKDIRELRDLTRYKTGLKHQRTQEKNRILKILEDANIKLGSVLTDVFGATGINIIESMLAGERNPKILANMAKGTARNKIPQLQESINGKISEHHKFMIKTMLNHIKDIDRTINEVMGEIDKKVKQYKTQIEHLDTIPGVNVEGAIGIISEIGTDMKKFVNAQQLSSYAGVCPGNNESAGKKKAAELIKAI